MNRAQRAISVELSAARKQRLADSARRIPKAKTWMGKPIDELTGDEWEEARQMMRVDIFEADGAGHKLKPEWVL